MKFATICTAVLLLAAAPAEKKKSDLDKMQGDWKVKSAQRGGQNAPPAILKARLNVEKNTFTISTTDPNGNVRKSPIQAKLDPSKSPKQIDFFDKAGKPNSHGIYNLEGRTLTICFDRASRARPKKFESPQGSRVQLLVFERRK